jgi:molybdopterin/thiamine biosynthesis adenylyltransferase
MTDEQLLRYSRHILLDEIGVEGQARLLASHALLVGAGGLGSPAGLFLGTAGVGRITIVDGDTVDLTNLQRQIAHKASRLGQPKAESLRQSILALNPQADVRAVGARVGAEELKALVAEADVVLDCSDNFATRHAINAACMAHGRPLVAGAAIGLDAQVSVYDPRDAACPCYACVFPADAAFEDRACATMGVLAPLVGVVGSLQAVEALKLLAGFGSSLAGRLQMLDARTMVFEEIRIPRDPRCPVCSPHRAAARPADGDAPRAAG